MHSFDMIQPELIGIELMHPKQKQKSVTPAAPFRAFPSYSLQRIPQIYPKKKKFKKHKSSYKEKIQWFPELL